MAQSGSVIARIVSQYSPKGTAAARKDLKKMEKQVSDMGKKVAKGFAIAGAAATAFAIKLGKDAVQGAIEDQRAQASLAVALRNTTGATDEAIEANSRYLDSLELQVAIDNEKLIPALQQLVTATGDLAQGQALLSLATDVSAASGKELSVVSAAISKAVNGNSGALTKLGLPLDANAVKTKDLSKLLIELSNVSRGQAAAAANTLSGQMATLNLKFKQVSEGLGEALMPVLLNVTNILIKDVIPQIEYYIFLNGDKLVQAFEATVKGGQDVARVLGKVYSVIKGVNDILPLGLAGWLQLAIGIKVFSVAMSGLISIISVVFVKMTMQKSLIEGMSLANRDFVKTLTESKSNHEKLLRVLYKVKAAYLGSAFAASKMGKAIAFATTQVKALTVALLRSPFALAVAGAIALGFALSKVLEYFDGKEVDKFNAKLSKADYSMYKASKGIKLYSGEFEHLNKLTNLNAQSMDDAHNKYKKKQEEKSKLTKKEIRQQKLLKQIQAQTLADQKKAQIAEANYARLNATLTKKAGVSLLSSEDQKVVQINAAIALADRQKDANKIDKERLKNLKEEVLLQKVRNDLALRYEDILKALADGKVDSKDIAILAGKWGVTTEAANAYVKSIFAIEDGTISDDEVIELAKSWGSTQAQAAQYLDFFVALNDGVLSDAEIEKLKAKWKLTTDQVLMYSDFVGVVNDGKLTDKEIEKLKAKWVLTTDQVVDYIKKIGSPVSYSGTLIDPAKAAEIGWKNAKDALQAYLDLLAKGTGVAVAVTAPAPNTDGNSQAAISAAAIAAVQAADAAVDAANAVAESEAALAKAMQEAADAAAASATFTEELTKQFPELMKSVAILEASQDAKESSGRSYTTDAEMDRILASVGGFGSNFGTPGGEYDERFRFQSPTMNTASGGGFQNSMAGNTTVNVTVEGSVTSEQDLVSAIRTGLLGAQYNGSQITLQAI